MFHTLYNHTQADDLCTFQAKGLLSEYQPKFNSAKAVYRERKKFIDDIDWNVLATPPTGSYKVNHFLGPNVAPPTVSYKVSHFLGPNVDSYDLTRYVANP